MIHVPQNGVPGTLPDSVRTGAHSPVSGTHVSQVEAGAEHVIAANVTLAANTKRFQLVFVSRLKAGSRRGYLGVYFEVLFHTLFSWLGLPVLGLIVAIILVSRTAWGKRVGVRETMRRWLSSLSCLSLRDWRYSRAGQRGIWVATIAGIHLSVELLVRFDCGAGSSYRRSGRHGSGFCSVRRGLRGNELAALPWRRLDCRSLVFSCKTGIAVTCGDSFGNSPTVSLREKVRFFAAANRFIRSRGRRSMVLCMANRSIP